MLYFPPGLVPDWLSYQTLPIVFPEGEKKCLALWQLAWDGLSDSAEQPRFLPIGLSGVWNWRGTVGKTEGPNGERQDVKGPIPDFDRIVWTKRLVIILFDSDVHTNDRVRIARLSLAKHLRELGANVRFADLPADCGVHGVDDYIGKYGAEKALALIQSAYDPKAEKADGAALGALTEEKLAQQFEAIYKDQLHYDHNSGRWYVWDEDCGRWRRNETRIAFHFSRETCRSLNEEEKKEFARASTYGGVERIAQCSPVFAVTNDRWDRDIWLLNTPGGTIDLRTGELIPARKSGYITKSTLVAPDSKLEMPVFKRFLNEITLENKDLQRYLQRIAGYSLTGSTKEEKLFFWYGPGGNGKTKLVNAQVEIAGDYAATATMEAFVERRGERHSTDIAALVGARLVTASETEKGRHWDEALIGRLTGGDPITARYMRRDNFTYTPQFTLIILGNHAPELSSVNEANRRRFRIVPFFFQPTEVDEDLPNKLRKEYPAILAWAIEGARDWCEDALGEIPQVVEDETEEYFAEQDHVKAWMDECCLVGENFSDTSANLFASFESWSRRNGENPEKNTSLIRTLKRQFNCKRCRSNKARGLTGIAVKVEYKPDPRTGERDDD